MLLLTSRSCPHDEPNRCPVESNPINVECSDFPAPARGYRIDRMSRVRVSLCIRLVHATTMD